MKQFYGSIKALAVLGLLCGVSASAWAGNVKGVVKFDGAVPAFKPIEMSGDPVCASHHTGPVYPEVLVVGDGNAMAHVLVSITKGVPAKAYPVPTTPAVLDQKGCQYVPHVLGVRAGQEIQILNPDGTLHNVHAMPKVNKEFNMAMPKFRTTATQKFDAVETTPFATKCDVHPWMTAWIAVFDHPFYAVTGKDGAFTISGLEPGEYELQAWHEKLGVKTATVTVAASGDAEVNFTFSKPA